MKNKSINKRLSYLHRCLPETLRHHRYALYAKLKKIQNDALKTDHAQKIDHRLDQIDQRIQQSIQAKKEREQKKPTVNFPKQLPITEKKDDIIQAIMDHPVVIISGETGSGKSTQIPKMCLEAGRGSDGMIGCTQPRRIAAISIARRIAEELGEDIGQSVGYQIRFQDTTPKNAYIKVMTDGILLSETLNDRYLNAYDTLIIDEAHERSLNIDFLLGYIQSLLKKRADLKMIITSATIDTQKFSKAFDHAPIIEVSGRLYPVSIEYYPKDTWIDVDEEQDITHVEMAVKSLELQWKKRRYGDTLIFMPTEQDIMETCDLIKARIPHTAQIIPLFARLPQDAQKKIFSPSTTQKIIVATNVAETSITIPNIRYVIDSGLARIPQYLPRTRTTALPVQPISKSSADQRKGRCGRVSDGICIRLFSEADYDERRQYTPPEIRRANLASVILQMMALRLGQVNQFPFVDPPEARSIQDGMDVLTELGAIQVESKEPYLTDQGRFMARLPIDPRIARMILEAEKETCVGEMMIISAALSIQDPRERPPEKEKLADQMHAVYQDPRSDFMTLLNLWYHYHDHLKVTTNQSQIRKYCRAQFLSYIRMREWQDIVRQLQFILEDQKMDVTSGQKQENQLYDAIHRCILSGFLSNIAQKKQNNMFLAAKNKDVMIFPGSSIFNRAGEWIVAAEMVETTRKFARIVGHIKSEWLEYYGKSLCRRRYQHPHWEKKRGEVVADEQIFLFGLLIVPKRRVSYGPIKPEIAKDIFIQSALVEGDCFEKFDFLIHNQELIKKIQEMENKTRRKDLLVSDEEQVAFYHSRLETVYDIRTLNHLIRKKRTDHFLKMSEEDLLIIQPDDERLSFFPDHVTLNGKSYSLSYQFSPGEADDGVTLKIPQNQISQVVPCDFEWLVYGLLKDKLTALIKGLPKRYRKQLVPINRTVDRLVDMMHEKPNTALFSFLSQTIHKHFHVDIPASTWQSIQLPDYLKMRFSLTNHHGKEVAAHRNIHELCRSQNVKPCLVSDAWASAAKKWERKNCTDWDFGDLPDSVMIDENRAGFLGLSAQDGQVDLKLFENSKTAQEKHCQGVSVLLSRKFNAQLKYFQKNWIATFRDHPGCVIFGGYDAVAKSMRNHLIRTLFKRPFQTQEAFEKFVHTLLPKLNKQAATLFDRVQAILDACEKVRVKIYAIETQMTVNPLIQEFCKQLRKDLNHLLPVNYLDIFQTDQLKHLPRYLKAMTIRAERGVTDIQKALDRNKEIKLFSDQLTQMARELNPQSSDEKRQALENLFWMIEEYKISLFAQELKTLYPVSAKRLEKKILEIRRMI
ncbi:MAG: ATP-dependent RNA helicase HrpA [Candidatus Magnetomorum sp.]|nr:ATP-dependent RNA helicase HrpA [Candidatus Magnetomorum sp.]